MKENIIINITQRNNSNPQILSYHYSVTSKDRISLGYGGDNLTQLNNKLKEDLESIKDKEKGLTIILKSDITNDSHLYADLVSLEDLNFISKTLSKDYKNIKLID